MGDGPLKLLDLRLGARFERIYEYNEIDPSDASVKGAEAKRSPPIDNER